MTKPVKIVLGLFATLLILVIIGVVVVLNSIDSLAKRAIEAGASYALGVPTTLDHAKVGLRTGTFSMTGLKVDNPKGFDGKFMTLGNGDIGVATSTLSADTIVVPRLDLANLEVDLARNASGANYQIIMDNVKRLQSGEKPKSTEPGKKFKINELSIKNILVHADLIGGPSGLTKLDVPIQEIKLTNIGSDGSGVDLPKLTSIILEAVLTAAIEKGGGILPADLTQELSKGLGELDGLRNVGVEAVGKVGEQLTKVGAKVGGEVEKTVQGVSKQAQDAADQLKKGLGDLIPPSKKPPK